MLERASGQFIVDGQVEDILGGISGAPRIARISQSCRFTGQLEGESMAEFTAVLPREGDGRFHGFQRVYGRLGEREGAFVLSVTGTYTNGQPRGEWTIVPRSGSGDFTHIRGSGTFSLPDGKPGRYRLEFDLRKPRAATKPATADVEAREPVAESETREAATESRKRKPGTRAAASADETSTTASPRRTRPCTAAPPAAPVETVTDPPKPRRTRKAAPPPIPEPIAASADPAPEKTSSRPSRRKQLPPPAPVAIPVPEPTPVRKRRAKAA